MATQTAKRHLIKPAGNERADVAQLNANMDNLDNAVPDTRKIAGKPLDNDVNLMLSDIDAVAITTYEIDAIMAQ